ncbi:flagellin-like hook-associated protein FlgL [Sphingomonas trueperi]|uniref:flagellin N-terminal helical domain-containing protein n=1 Tax=Sphingomonas trueperi TaxID=53317 RepID=UPI0033976E85
MLSILTNTGAADAVRALNAATAEVQVHQERISTGKRVHSTKDDSADYITAQQLHSDADGRRAIGKSMANAGSVLDVANLGAEQIGTSSTASGKRR